MGFSGEAASISFPSALIPSLSKGAPAWNDSGRFRPHSITAAFRMHTIVARAGSGPRFRIVWGRSQR
jgi:hypothetical protein